jgi:hypothetical protein
VQRSLCRRDATLRICKDSYLVADCRTIEDVALIFALGTP